MSPPGDADLLIAARSALLDALEALAPHLDRLVLVGAQAIYLQTGNAEVALAEATKDSDLAVDSRGIGDEPLLEKAMGAAGFRRTKQPGGWVSPRGVPVDLMLPKALSGPGGSKRSRGGRIPPHDKHATRVTPGLEAAVVDNKPMTITALAPDDDREATVAVAGLAALLVAKLYKLGERQDDPGRLVDKDAHDIYRLLVATTAEGLGARLGALSQDDLGGETTRNAIVWLEDLFGSPTALGSTMAGRAEQLVGNPATVSASVAALASDVLAVIGQLSQSDPDS